MLKRKMSEFQKSVKRFTTRLLILAAIVVFGAIAIAQAKKQDELASKPPANVPPEFTGTASPIASTSDPSLAQAAFSEPAELDIPDSETQPVGQDYETAPTGFDTSSTESYDLPDNSYDLPDESNGYADDVPSYDPPEYSNELVALPDDAGDPLPAYDPSNDISTPADSDSGYSTDYAAALSSSPAAEAAPVRENPMRPSLAPEDVAGDQEPPLQNQGYDLPAANNATVDPYTTEAANTDYAGLLESNESSDPYLPTTTNQDSLPADEYGQEPPQYDRGYDDYSNTTQPSLAPERSNSPVGQDPYTDTYSDTSASSGTRSQLYDSSYSQSNSSGYDNNLSVENRSAQVTGRSTGRPGPANLEGPQTPSVTIEKLVPAEVQVGRPARFQIKVRNVGQVPAENVFVRDEIPEGTTFVDASPRANQDADGAIYWEVGTLNPGEESTVTMEVTPVKEGQLGSVATVSLEASATAKVLSTKPALTVEHTAAKTVLLGETVKFNIKISNPGTGVASQVTLEEDVPTGLYHSSGPKLEYEVGAIQPGKVRHLELVLKADKPGKVINRLVAKGEGNLIAEDTIELDVIAPELKVGIDGPNRRYLDREAKFTVSVANPGTAPAKNVELVAKLPPGLRFVSTNNSGYFDQGRNAVIWSLTQLPAGEMGKAEFTAIPTQMGDFNVRAEGKAERELADAKEHAVTVEGIAALYFGLVDQVDPIEVGGETTYILTVENQGSKTASNVVFLAEVPPGMKPINGEGPTNSRVQGQQVLFEPIRSLSPKQKLIYKINVQGVQPGDQKLRVKMVSDDISTPVIKEESTRVYTD
ncbi:MAG: DUF11 domain-containing protein [Planctomycetales bacterium]|nr:DUF11 domain-containing protein [Planctomycetales bacterium]